MEILHSESFWVAIAFLIFVILSFKKIKKILIESLDKQINEIKNRIIDIKKIKQEAENNLNEAKKNLKKITNEKKIIINEANKESKILQSKLLNEEKISNERFKKKITDRIEQSRNQVISDLKKNALMVSVKSLLELLKSKKNKNEDDLIAKSITKLFNKEKELKKEL
tara:strand:+ start:322 stop:825 length:504 start_codon:yes stop_codon:yes gene_type:complete